MKRTRKDRHLHKDYQQTELVIKPKIGIQFLDWKELSYYRDLFAFLIWRQIRVRYAQSAIGIGWAVIQPLFSMLVFTIVFGNLAKVSSDGAPYALFSLTALLPWTYFSNSLLDGVSSLVSEANMIRKIYFPRLLIPTSAIASKLVDFAIADNALPRLNLLPVHPIHPDLHLTTCNFSDDHHGYRNESFAVSPRSSIPRH